MDNEYTRKLENPNVKNRQDDWIIRHMAALAFPRPGFERALIDMYTGWLRYADVHKSRYASGIGSDGVLGDAWTKIGSGLLTLLNGETGRFDCGLLDRLVRGVVRSEALNPNDL